MPCAKQYFNVAGAGICGSSSALGAILGGGTPATWVGLVGVIGSVHWLISGLIDLIDCLRKKGKFEEAARLQEHVDALQREVDELKKRWAS